MSKQVYTIKRHHVRVSLHDVIDGTFETFLDLLAEGTGQPLLQDIQFRLEGCNENDLFFGVEGYVDKEDFVE